MKRKLRVSLYLFIFTTLFLIVFTNTVLAAVTPSSVLTSITEDIEMKRKVTESLKENGDYLNVSDSFILKSSKNYDSEKKCFVINKKEYTLQVRYKSGKNKYVKGSIESTADNIIFRPTMPIEKNKNYVFELVDSSGKVVASATTSKKYDPEIVVEQTPNGLGILDAAGSLVVKDYRRLGRILIETLCKIITPAGDAFLDMVCNAVGEVATIDGAVYNRIDKVNIDFFSKSETNIDESGHVSGGVRAPLRTTMGSVVNVFYGVFRKIAIAVLLVMLIYIGIKIMFTSTAEKKASYKSLFLAWVMGVTMLMFFPYVMKYTIQLNNALCTWIGGENDTTPKLVNGLEPATYGTDVFIGKILLDDEYVSQNAMMYVRYYGANFFNLPLLIVYFVLIGQLLAILIMYYKRVFMLAFLISIFPLVAMIYPLNKIGDVRMNPFGTWFKEFLVNVFVQSFHAATYRVVVSLGVTSYFETGNWLFMLMCILFLFEGEKIIRAIFNAKSSMNSIGDMAMAGAMAMNMMKNAGNLLPDLGKGSGSSEKDEELSAMNKARKDRVLPTAQSTPATASNLATARGLSGGGNSATNVVGTSSGVQLDSVASYSGTPIETTTSTVSSGVQIGRESTVDTSKPFTTVSNQISATSKDKGIGNIGSKIAKGAGTAFNATAQVTGATVGMTYGMAQSDAQAAVAGLAAGASTGAKIGKAGKNLVVGAVDKVSDIRAASILADEYRNEEHDEEIGITDDMDAKKAAALREAYAKLASRTAGFGSKEAAQLKFIKERIDIETK